MTTARVALALKIVDSTLYLLLPGRFDCDEATVLLTAIALQESRMAARRQAGNGPARGLWQFERGGGVAGVLNHPSSRLYARSCCLMVGVEPLSGIVHTALENNDLLACAFARLLLWTDPLPLPAIGDEAGAWSCYLRTWRPGRPHPETWGALYAEAAAAFATLPTVTEEGN